MGVAILDQITAQKKIMLPGIIKDFKRKYPGFGVDESWEESSCKSFYDALAKPGLSIIGEIKKASPSKGVIRSDFDPVELALAYDNHVEAISVLTEEYFFQGHLDYLKAVGKKVSLPLLCKDFMIDPVQIDMASSLGASAILLIAAILSKDQLQEYLLYAECLGMDALVEVHTEAELDKVLQTDARIIGINNRNLKDFTTDLSTTINLGKMIPKTHLVVSESGIYTGEDISFISSQVKIDAVLVGESFMKTADISVHGKELRDGYKG